MMWIPTLDQSSIAHKPSLKSDKTITSRRLQATSDTALVWGALAFTLRFTQFFGTAPLSFKRECNCWRIGVSPAMCVYSYVLIIVVNVMVFTAVIRDGNVPSKDSVRMNINSTVAVQFASLGIMAVISVYGIVNGPSRMKQLIVYLDHINMIFTNLKYEHYMQKPEKLRCCFIIAYVVGVIFMCIGRLVGSGNDEVNSNKSLITFSMYAFANIEVLILCFLEMQFVLSAMMSHTAFQFVNNELTALIIDIDLKKSSSWCWSEKIHRLSLAYSSICDAVRRIDKSYGLLVLMLLLSFLIQMVATPFFLITFILTKEREYVSQVFLCIFHTSKLVMIVEPGHRMQQEMARTQVLIGQLMNRVSPRDPMMDALNLFNKQITLNPVVFSPLGICTLSRHLIASILGAVTTYLVILIQFRNSGNYF